jgi:hypothetical protein
MNVQIKVVGQKLILPDNSYRYISGSRNFIYIVFNLDSDWNNMNVCAEFAQENNVYSYLLDNNNGIHFPSGIEPGVCKISLRGSKKGVTATTDSITLYVDQYSGSEGDVITTYFVDTSEGNVTEDDIPVGKIAFSKGVRIEGKHICNDGITLPEISDAAYEDDVFLGKEYIDGDGVKRTGKFTIDEELTEQDALITQITNALRNKAANNDPVALPELGDTAAQPSDIAYGKVLYDDEGNPVTGTLGDFKPGDEGQYIFRTNARVSGVTGLFVEAESSLSASPIIHRPGSTATVQISSAAFGTAARSQVMKGVTFTSEVGLLAEGELEEIEAGAAIGANEDVKVSRNSDGTIQILAKTNWGDSPGTIVRNGAYLRITAPESVFDGIFGGTDDVTIDGETLVFGENGTATIENETLIL